MVCPRCVMAVEDLLKKQGFHPVEVQLGYAQVSEDLIPKQIETVRAELTNIGFELLDDPQSKLVEQIRTAVIEWVRLEGDREKLSSFILERIPKDYSLLSKLFTEVRGMTIERYCILQRIELAKELLCYSELNMSEIAFRMGYSSPAHFSAQFKQETGMSPKEFKMQNELKKTNQRRPLDQV